MKLGDGMALRISWWPQQSWFVEPVAHTQRQQRHSDGLVGPCLLKGCGWNRWKGPPGAESLTIFCFQNLPPFWCDSVTQLNYKLFKGRDPVLLVISCPTPTAILALKKVLNQYLNEYVNLKGLFLSVPALLLTSRGKTHRAWRIPELKPPPVSFPVYHLPFTTKRCSYSARAAWESVLFINDVRCCWLVFRGVVE